MRGETLVRQEELVGWEQQLELVVVHITEQQQQRQLDEPCHAQRTRVSSFQLCTTRSL